ncbi:MBL fold metallo-hydrolase [Isoptericola halotolerans]|uniref:Glyoxylase-like metal-dependent hydrolase (Beta-lactamase superfamily II) n=1 Tax=Isoptericola halotolerans TaxID=300560 RepID=A0ABX2A528_9MICO|nr:MBL fold metallo-hydrolase [Isoptericola halotolerans]NOV97960.1 glyoxylase-like metal-dependent hydrolase (beta-lactamase superfamily II) [Isoptericola halotolerans]
MDVRVVVAPVFGTNCCVVTADAERPDGRRDCVVVDAGAGTVGGVLRLVEEHDLVPQAVLATHGHVDHTWDAAAVCETFGVPLRLHEADAYRVADPFGTIGLGSDEGPVAAVSEALTQALTDFGCTPRDYRAPAWIEPFDGTAPQVVAGDVHLRALHAPGHTEGSTLFLVDGGARRGVVLSGDVLFAGGVGRTDLPGADVDAMLATLRGVVASLDPALGVVPGHGPTTTVGHELATNPFLGG